MSASYPQVVITFLRQHDPLSSDIKDSLSESGIDFESKPITVEHYTQDGGSHELSRISILVSSVAAVVSWLATRGFVMFGKSISVEVAVKDGSTKVTARTVEEVERLLIAARAFQQPCTPATAKKGDAAIPPEQRTPESD